jgi:PAS domain S-box-containing protein
MAQEPATSSAGGRAPDEPSAAVDELFRSLSDGIPAIIWVDGADRRCVYVNDTWRSLLGRDRSEALGLGWSDSVHPDDREGFERAWHGAFERREPYAAEYRLRRHDGSYVVVNDQAVPRSAPDGTFLGYVGAAVDVTPQRAIEAELRRERDRSRRSADRIRALQRLTAALSAVSSTVEVATAVAAHAFGPVGARAGTIGVLSDDGSSIEIVASHGFTDDEMAAWRSLPMDLHAPGPEAIRTRRTVLLGTRAAIAERYPGLVEVVEQTGDHAWACAPLIADGDAIGMVFASFAEEETFDTETVETLETIARLCVQAMQRASVYEAEQERAQRSETLQRLAASLAAAATPEEVASVIVAQGADALGARAGLVGGVADDGSVEVLASWGFPQALRDAMRVTPRSANLPGNRVIATGEPLLLRDVRSIVDAFPHLQPTGGSVHEEAWATFPMVVGRDPIGFLHFSYARPQVFDERQVGELSTVVAHAAQAMDRARLFEREHEVARILQESLLGASVFATDRLALASRYLPGSVQADIGGDWFDAFALPGDTIAIAVGDVVGRGVQAAASMGQLRSALRALALQGGGPATVLQGLERFAAATAGAASATVAYAEVHLTSGRVRYACAGHPPPLMRSGDVVHVLDGGRSSLLGSGSDGKRSEGVATLSPGDPLLLYTDGLIERRRESIDDGVDRLIETFASMPDRTPDEVCDVLLDALVEDEDRHDDIAVLCVQLRAPGERALVRSVRPDASELVGLRRDVRAWLDVAGADAHRTADLVAAVHEATANAIEHGSHAGHDIVVEGRLDGDDVIVTVRDSGWWTLSPIANRVGGVVGDADSVSRGRGLTLMRSLVDSVRISTGPAGTQVELRSRLGT